MAHELEFVKDKNGNMVAAMAYAGEVPWHKHGHSVLGDLTPHQMMEKSHTNWGVYKIPAYAEVAGTKVSVDRSVLVRDSDNKILSVVSTDWEPMQNADAFDFFNEFVMAGDMQMHTAGSLRGGKIVWALAKVNESFSLFGGDQIDSYLLFTNPHEFGKSIDIRFTPIRVVCNNTLTLSLNTKSEKMVKVSHRNVFNPEYVKETLGIAKSKLANYQEMAQFLGSKKYTHGNLVDYYKEIFPLSSTSKKEMSKNAKLAYDIVETQPGSDFAPGTWWNAFNSVTFLTDHSIGRNEDNRLSSAWYGVNKILKTHALEKAVEYASVS